MSYDPERRHRRSIRLKGYDYSRDGAYFVTVCTQDRSCLFGEVIDDEMRLNDAGRIAEQCWLAIPNHFPRAQLDAFVVMPNHVHGIIVIANPPVGANDYSPHMVANDTPDVGANDYSPLHSPDHDGSGVGANDYWPNVRANDYSPLQHSPQRSSFRSPSKTVGSIIRGFKIGVTKWFRENTDIYTVWQRNYYEHIIRTEDTLHRIRRYIATNPMRWHLDRENHQRLGEDEFDEWLRSFTKGITYDAG